VRREDFDWDLAYNERFSDIDSEEIEKISEVCAYLGKMLAKPPIGYDLTLYDKICRKILFYEHLERGG